jgi:uncharacterized protein YndB with AHSA1/START domain
MSLLQTYELFIRATPDEVWQALIDGDETEHYFFGTRVSVEPKKGARIAWTSPDGGLAVDGEIVECAPESKLVHTWTTRYDPELAKESSVVSWEIEKRGDAVRLLVTHQLPRAPKTAAHVASDGWSLVLSGLKTYLETGKALKVPTR